LIAQARGSITLIDRDGLIKHSGGAYGEPDTRLDGFAGHIEPEDERRTSSHRLSN